MQNIETFSALRAISNNFYTSACKKSKVFGSSRRFQDVMQILSADGVKNLASFCFGRGEELELLAKISTLAQGVLVIEDNCSLLKKHFSAHS